MLSVMLSHAAPTIYQDVEPEYHVGDTMNISYGPYTIGPLGMRVLLSVNGGRTFRGCLADQWFGANPIDPVWFSWWIRGASACDTPTMYFSIKSDSCVIGVVDREKPQDTARSSMFKILPAVGVITRRVPASTTNASIDAPTFDLRGRVDDGSRCGVKVMNSRQLKLTFKYR
jgi:hypothetical protein